MSAKDKREIWRLRCSNFSLKIHLAMKDAALRFAKREIERLKTKNGEEDNPNA